MWKRVLAERPAFQGNGFKPILDNLSIKGFLVSMFLVAEQLYIWYCLSVCMSVCLSQIFGFDLGSRSELSTWAPGFKTQSDILVSNLSCPMRLFVCLFVCPIGNNLQVAYADPHLHAIART